MNRHKDLKPGEVFVFNTNVTKGVKIPDHFSSLKTMRLGEQAYGTGGQELEPKYMRPVFIDRSELEEMNRIWTIRIRNFGRQ